MKLLFIFILSASLVQVAFSQATVSGDLGIIYINKNTSSNQSLSGKRGGFYGKHPLGESIASTYDKFLKLYVAFVAKGGAYAVDEKVISKKDIYTSILQIDKSLKKEVRQKNITKEEAIRRFDTVLQTAINVRYYDTFNLERLLSVSRESERKEQIFNSIEIRN